MTLEVRKVDVLSRDREGLRAAYLAGQTLIEQRWHAWPPPCWDQPAVLVYDGEECVAGINFSRDDKMLTVAVDFLWCASSHPAALTACLAAFRAILRSEAALEVKFSCHPGNAAMMKFAEKLKLEPSSLSFRVPRARFAA